MVTARIITTAQPRSGPQLPHGLGSCLGRAKECSASGCHDALNSGGCVRKVSSCSSLSLKCAEEESAGAGAAGLVPQGTTHAGHYCVDYQRYSVRQYVNLPLFLCPFVRLPGLSSFLVVARPSIDASAGLARYREVLTKAQRRRAPFFMVVDRPGLAHEDGKYYWVEFPLPDVFKLDVSGMRSFDDYAQKHLRRRHRRAWRVRQQELEGSPIRFEYLALHPGNRPLVDQMWRLYLANGQRHGFAVLSRRDFYRVHLGGTPGLTVLLARDDSQGGQIVTFVTRVRSGDTLISMWCGTDYDNPLSRSCSTYINAQYEFVRIAIKDPDVRWLDLGAQLRQMKTGLGAAPYTVAGYLRCKSRLMRALMERLMKAYFNPAKLLTDA